MSHDEPGLITSGQAFDAMAEYIWRFAQRAGDDLLTLLGDTGRLPSGELGDPAAWDDWVSCVEYVKGGGAVRSGDPA